MRYIGRTDACSYLLLGLLLALTALDVQAQERRFGRVEETETNIDSYYYYVQPGAAAVAVKVLGTVRNPGLYLLSEGTDLGKLLALSGGPVLDPRQRSIEHTAIIRLFRPRTGGQALIYKAELEGGVVTEPEAYPALEDGDVMTVEVIKDRGFTWRDVFTVTNTVVLIALTVTRLVR